jgi:hypothetical protein
VYSGSFVCVPLYVSSLKLIWYEDGGSVVAVPAEAGNFSLHHRVQNVSGAHLASYTVGTTGSFPGGKVAGA